MDEQLGPVALSVRKDSHQYRIIVRTSELLTLRGSVPEETLPGGRTQQSKLPTREILELVAPEVQMSCLKLGTPAAEEALARLDEQGLSNRYKVGVLYCRAGQRTEEEMYNNQHAGPAFLEFLDSIGKLLKYYLHVYHEIIQMCVYIIVLIRPKNKTARVRRLQSGSGHEDGLNGHARGGRDSSRGGSHLPRFHNASFHTEQPSTAT